MSKQTDLKCPSCGNTELCFGYFGNTTNVFVPTGIFTLHGYKTRSYLCIQCGHLGQFMTQDRVRKIRDRLKSRFE